MGTKSTIEWTGATWNPVTGCAAVSEGCRHCYAARLTHGRLRHNPRYAGLTNTAGHFNGVVKCHEDLLDVPLHWRKPRMIFVNSMSDLFHVGVPFDFIVGVYATMIMARQHTYQILTKRPERAAEILSMMATTDNLDEELSRRWEDRKIKRSDRRLYDIYTAGLWPPPNVWLGTSCEDQATFDARVPHLTHCPTAVRFVSLEPLLGPIVLRFTHLLNWVIVSGESGPGARPMQPDWVRSIRDQCVAAGVPFFWKQFGKLSNNPDPKDHTAKENGGHAKGGRLLDGRTWDEMPEVNHVGR